MREISIWYFCLVCQVISCPASISVSAALPQILSREDENMSVYCFQLYVLYMHLLIFQFPTPFPLLSQFVLYPVISEIPRYRSAINKNNIMMLLSSVQLDSMICVRG